MSLTVIDDRDPRLTFSPPTAWSRQLVCDECRGIEDGGAFIGRVGAVAGAGTWTTALGNNPTSNVTLRFRGSGVQARFILFTRVQELTSTSLLAENMAQLSLFINGTRYDPAPLAFRSLWPEDSLEQDFIGNLALLAQDGLGPGIHDLVIQYALDTTLGLPQVVLAFDRLEIFAGANPTISLVPSVSSSQPSSTLRITGTPVIPPARSTERIAGISVGIALFLAIVISFFGAIWWSRRKERKNKETFIQERFTSYSPPSAPRFDHNFGTRHYRGPDSVDINQPLTTEITPFISNSNSPKRKISTTSSFGNAGPLPASPAPPVPRLPKALRSPVPRSPAPERPLPPIPDGSPASIARSLVTRPAITPMFYQPKRKLDVPVVDHGDYYTIASMSDTRTSGISFEPRETKDGRYFHPPSYLDDRSP